MTRIKTALILPSLALPIVVATLVGCNQQSQSPEKANALTANPIAVSISNQLGVNRFEETVTVTSAMLAGAGTTAQSNTFNFKAFTIKDGNTELPSQAIDSDGDGEFDALVFNTQLDANSNKQFVITPNSKADSASYPKRTHAEISINQGGSLVDGKYQSGKFVPVKFQQIPKDHKPGDLQFRYEGPGWESDKIAYRLYFDHRNVIDIFGKKVPDMVLPQVGHIGYSYHKEADWGMDILKVGPSLGIGGVGMRVDGKVQRVDTAKDMSANIVSDGVLQSHVQIKHAGWQINQQQYDLTSDLTISAGSRLTHNSLTISPDASNLVTGIVKHQPSEFIKSNNENSDWAYIATFGKQSYVHDELGMAILYKQSSLIELSEDLHNHLVVMKPKSGKLDYYFLGSWAQDGDAITSKQAFTQYLDQVISELNQPLQVKLTTKK